MFGTLAPSVKNLLNNASTWTATQSFKSQTPALANIQQVSPATVWTGNGWRTNSPVSSIPVHFRSFVQPVQSSGTPYGYWNLQGGSGVSPAFADLLNVYNTNPDGNPGARTDIKGAAVIETQMTSSDATSARSLNIFNTSGGWSSFAFSFGTINSVKSAITANNTGDVYYKALSTNGHTFYIGSISSGTYIAQIYSSGFYNNYNNYNNGKVTAGNADTSAASTLNTYGSFSAKGVLVTSQTYTMGDEVFVYVDPTYANFCSGTPSACSTYTNSTTCGNHSAVGCSWFSGFPCSDYSGTDSSTCTSGHTGCTWDQTSCEGANNTDFTTCESQDDAWGGNCSWNTSICPAFTNSTDCGGRTGCSWNDPCSSQTNQTDCTNQPSCTWNYTDCSTYNGSSQGICEGHSGCGWTGADCHLYDSTSQSECETSHTGCAWDTDNSICNGVYNEDSTCSGQTDTSCTGGYCSGNICTGNYNLGTCSGTWGTFCDGTAACSNLTASGSSACNAESGCAWTSGITIKLPFNANSNRQNTARMYSIMHVGSTGTVVIQGQSGEPIFQYTTLSLFKKGDKVIIHNQNISFPCNQILTQTPCEAQTGCSWTGQPCSSFNGTSSSTCTTGHSGCSWFSTGCSGYIDQTTCEANGCAWNESCVGKCSGTWGYSCTGTYSNNKYWYAHSLERGLNYVAKTANYTITDIDDIVDCTSNSFTLTLPDATLNNGKQYTLKNTGTGTITLNTTSSQTIDGNASGVLTLVTGDSMVIVSNNQNWVVV